VLDDGSDSSGWPLPAGRQVTGWRAACECGWRGVRVWSRDEWPSDDGFPPESVEDEGCYRQWQAHLHEVLPELAVYDAAQAAEAALRELNATVIDARSAGCSWERIGHAAGMARQSAHERWDELVRAATAPIPLDGRPPGEPLDSFGADVARRCRIARRLEGGHPSSAWSTSERLAVALVLRDWDHLTGMGYTQADAQQRVLGGLHTRTSDFGAWLDRIRFELNSAAGKGA